MPAILLYIHFPLRCYVLLHEYLFLISCMSVVRLLPHFCDCFHLPSKHITLTHQGLAIFRKGHWEVHGTVTIPLLISSGRHCSVRVWVQPAWPVSAFNLRPLEVSVIPVLQHCFLFPLNLGSSSSILQTGECASTQRVSQASGNCNIDWYFLGINSRLKTSVISGFNIRNVPVSCHQTALDCFKQNNDCSLTINKGLHTVDCIIC